MNPLIHIRRTVFKASQLEMARIAGVSQATWSRWETGHHSPKLENIRAMRAEACRRKLPWNDDWFLTLEAA